jgi:hypothetical protein
MSSPVSTAVVQWFCKPKVGGSNPSPGTIFSIKQVNRREAYLRALVTSNILKGKFLTAYISTRQCAAYRSSGFAIAFTSHTANNATTDTADSLTGYISIIAFYSGLLRCVLNHNHLFFLCGLLLCVVNTGACSCCDKKNSSQH